MEGFVLTSMLTFRSGGAGFSVHTDHLRSSQIKFLREESLELPLWRGDVETSMGPLLGHPVPFRSTQQSEHRAYS